MNGALCRPKGKSWDGIGHQLLYTIIKFIILPEDARKSFWSVDNGTILCNSMGDSTHNYVWLMHDQEFENFELRLKFQAYEDSPGNSGVQIRSRDNENEMAKGGFWLDGPQVDIDPPSQWRT